MNHNFNFPGGDILADIGASWFVSYFFYEKIASTHTNWNSVSTTQLRISKYNASRQYHNDWLQRILEMNPNNLNKNTIALDSDQIKAMAQVLILLPLLPPLPW